MPIAQEIYAGFDKKTFHIVVFGAAGLWPVRVTKLTFVQNRKDHK